MPEDMENFAADQPPCYRGLPDTSSKFELREFLTRDITPAWFKNSKIGKFFSLDPLPEERIEIVPVRKSAIVQTGRARSTAGIFLAFWSIALLGIPAHFLAWMWAAFGMSAMWPGVTTAQVFMYIYLVTIGAVIPPCVVLLSFLIIARLTPSLAARFVLCEDGFGWRGDTWLVDRALSMTKHQVMSGMANWDEFSVVLCGEPQKSWVAQEDLAQTIKGLVFYYTGKSYLLFVKPKPEKVGWMSRRSSVYQRMRYVPLGAFTDEQKRQLLQGILKWRGQLKVAPEVYTALGARAGQCQDERYTRLWLKLLEASTGGGRTDSLRKGEHIGPFEITDRIETGGQANVYKANVVDHSMIDVCFVPSMVDQVVLKEFILSGVDQAARILSGGDFENECMLLSKFKSPNIVRLYDLFIEERRAYLVLEYIDGHSVRRLVEANGPMSERRTIDIAMAICEALKELHDQTPAMVHRDVSPENIVVGSKATKLVDFSLAVPVGDRTETVVGKQAYISPSQFRGEISAANDIYALGATMFFMLTGEEPEPIAQQHVHELAPNVSQELHDIIAKCTNVEGSEYANAGELLNALQKLSPAPEECVA